LASSTFISHIDRFSFHAFQLVFTQRPGSLGSCLDPTTDARRLPTHNRPYSFRRRARFALSTQIEFYSRKRRWRLELIRALERKKRRRYGAEAKRKRGTCKWLPQFPPLMSASPPSIFHISSWEARHPLRTMVKTKASPWSGYRKRRMSISRSVMDSPKTPLDVVYLSGELAELFIGVPDDKRFRNRKFQFDKSVFLLNSTLNPLIHRRSMLHVSPFRLHLSNYPGSVGKGPSRTRPSLDPFA
jgi:hypothetical protein